VYAAVGHSLIQPIREETGPTTTNQEQGSVMNKITSFALASLMTLSLTGCGQSADSSATAESTEPTSATLMTVEGAATTLENAASDLEAAAEEAAAETEAAWEEATETADEE
jgi:basic membrane lipoprotein Med (substrate-binding protein (PBP1-ABC) superfamily)